MAQETPGLKQAIFDGGCFWGVEAVFSHVKGVTSAVSGYHGGAANTAHYDDVGHGNTGHAESVRVTYDPAQVRYDDLLRIFFAVIIDPTQANGQGPDIGPQYRSALVPIGPEQDRVARAYLSQIAASGLWRGRIATKIEPYRQFYAAEGEHQDFMAATRPTPISPIGTCPRWPRSNRCFQPSIRLISPATDLGYKGYERHPRTRPRPCPRTPPPPRI
jgi:peptide-methionine (S)-S-oxide reductase